MKSLNRTIATVELFLVFPASLFMAALFFRAVQPPSYEPARTAAAIVDWYAVRPRLGLLVALMALPLATAVTGVVVLARRWHADTAWREAVREIAVLVREQLAMIVIAGATVCAAAILAVVALHVMTD
jgi:hypothetical protein